MGIKKNFFALSASGLGATRRAAMLLLLMMLTTAMAWAQEVVASGYCGAPGQETYVEWELTGEPSNYTLTISGSGAMYDYDVNSNPAPWSSYAEQIREVVIENDVTSIGDYAFKGTGLTSIEIPASVKSIGAFAFYECTNLGSNQGSVTFAEGSQLESIGESAFNSCTVLTSIEIPASVTSIGNYAFSECHILGSVIFAEGSQLKSIGAYAFSGTGLTSIEIPAGVKSIGEAAFTGSGLTSIEIPASVTSIGEDAFSFCNNLGSVTFAEGSQLESIGTNAFQSSGLTSITIPASVESIGENVFHNCNNLASMAVADGNTDYDSRNGCNAIIEKLTNTLIIGCKNSTIPASVTSIGDYAFNTTRLTSIEIPASVTSIGNRAFLNCTSLATVTVYAQSCSLGDAAFANCNNLANIYVFSEKVASYQAAWSAYASKIKTLPNPHGYCGTTGHETDVIWVLTGESPYYTLTISGMGDMADYSNPEERPWHDNAEKITNVVIEEGVTSIGEYAFLDFVGLTSVTIPASVESIGASAFDGCSGLESITIPDNVTSIGDYAFSNCRGLTSVTIPANVGSIGVGAFRGCSNLETMTVDGENTVYESSNDCIIETLTKTLIAGCKNTIIPNDVTIVTIIGDYAFYNCSNLESITIPDNVTSIGFSAFEGCSGLTSIEIPASVTSIGNYAFEGCSDLTSVTVYAQSCSLGVAAFDGCNDNLKIYVFKDYVDTYKAAENWSAYEDIIKGIKGGYCGTTDHETDVIWVLTGESLTISGTGAMADYDAPEKRPWKDYVGGISNVVIENGVTSIGLGAFQDCTGLTSIEIPTSVTSIGDYAFYGCTGLTSIVIPASVTTIGNQAFFNCQGLTSVTVYAPSCSLGTMAFDEWNVDLKIYVFSHLVSQYQTIWSAYASKITEIIGGYCGTTDHETDVIWVLTGESPNYTLTISGMGAIADLGQLGIYAVNIKTIVIENGVTSICDNAFNSCTGLTSVTIPASVKSIGEGAFSNCTGLTSVTVYAPSCSLGNDAFEGCSELEIYVFSDLVDTYKGAENWSYYAGIITGIIGGYCGTTGHKTDVIWVLTGDYPNYALTISGTGKMAAYDDPTERPWDNNAADISNVVIENGVTTIGNYAFFCCQGLTSVTIPASVTSIGDYAFAECQGLTSVTKESPILDPIHPVSG